MAHISALAATALLAATFPGCSTTMHSSSKVACARARVGGTVVCLKPGKPCSSGHERIYRSYALTCKRGVLRERNYIGPANP